MVIKSAASPHRVLLDKLYPDIPHSSGNLALPGPTRKSGKALIDLLKHNHEHYHCYFDPRGFHNHASHHLFSIYALGSSSELLREAYKTHTDYLLPAIKSPASITDENFLEHLGDDHCYTGYLAFFSNYLMTHSPAETIERFIFSQEFNYIPDLDEINARDVAAGGTGTKQQPAMLDRFCAGLLHPFIHLGYGVEFGVLGQIAEGLAQAAVHHIEHRKLIPSSLFIPTQALDDTTALLNKFGNLSLSPVNGDSHMRGTFALHRALIEDPRLAASALNLDPRTNGVHAFLEIAETAGDIICEHVEAWYHSWLAGVKDDEAELEQRLAGMIEETIFGHALWYGVGGWAARGDRVLNAEFFLVHLVTSAVFLPNFLLPSSDPTTLNPPLSLAQRLLFLRAFIASSAGWYVARGRPVLPIASFYKATESLLASPPPKVHEAGNGIPEPEKLPAMWPGETIQEGGSQWARIWGNVVVHPNEHLCKTARALGAFANRYSDVEEGHFGKGGIGLEGRECLDGTLFVRVAALSMQRLGWAYEGDELASWDRQGCFESC